MPYMTEQFYMAVYLQLTQNAVETLHINPMISYIVMWIHNLSHWLNSVKHPFEGASTTITRHLNNQVVLRSVVLSIVQNNAKLLWLFAKATKFLWKMNIIL